MNTYPYIGDRQLEPEDTSIEEAAAERAEIDDWEEFLESGDPSEMLEDYISEDEGLSCELISAYQAGDNSRLLNAARNMAAKLEKIAEGYLS